MINTLKSILVQLDSNYTKVITNFNKYKHLLFFSAKYLELTEKEKKHFSIEMIFNIYKTNFNDNVINKEINNNLLVYDYYYSLFNQQINKFPISDTTYWDIFIFLINHSLVHLQN